MERLLVYDWPGNIRELRNVIERAVVLSPGPTLLLDELADPGRAPIVPTGAVGASRTLADVAHEHILRVLESCGWRVRGAGHAPAPRTERKPALLAHEAARHSPLGAGRESPLTLSWARAHLIGADAGRVVDAAASCGPPCELVARHSAR